MYHRADTLPMEVREGLRGTKTIFQTLLVFRREARERPVDAPLPVEAEALYGRPDPAVTGSLGSRLKGGAGKLLDGIMARPARKEPQIAALPERATEGARAEPVFQHEPRASDAEAEPKLSRDEEDGRA